MSIIIKFIVCIVLLTIPSVVFAAKTHRVKKHETLYTLAKKYHVSVDDLKGANNLVNNQVIYGQTLVIPPRTASKSEVSESNATTYKVKQGETLLRISRKTGVSVSELKRLNGLNKNRVKLGQVLVLQRTDNVDEPRQKIAKKVSLRHRDLFNEKDYEQSLAELADPDPSKPVDLSQNLELKTNIQLLKNSAYGFLGARYRFGGNSRSGLDCSSFVQQVFREMEVSLPRTAREQFQIGNEVSPGDLQKGDLVFFHTYARYPSHVGIYLGNNKMIHASSRDRRVVISSMDTPYYRARFIGAKRIDKINPQVFKFDDLIMGIEEESADDAIANDMLGLQINN